RRCEKVAHGVDGVVELIAQRRRSVRHIVVGGIQTVVERVSERGRLVGEEIFRYTQRIGKEQVDCIAAELLRGDIIFELYEVVAEVRAGQPQGKRPRLRRT